MPKEKAAGGEKETSKGGFASEQTPHPSSCPPLAADRPRPFRCSSSSHTNRFAGFAWEPSPLCNPPENDQGRGDSSSLEPSPLRISEMSGFLFSVYSFAFVGVDAHIDPIKIANSPRNSVKQHILPGRCGHRPLRPSIEQTLSEFHTSNIQRAQMKRLTLCTVRLGNPILRPPEGRSLRDAPSVNGIQEQNAFSARQRYFASQRLFFAYFFLTSQKKACRRRHALAVQRKMAEQPI